MNSKLRIILSVIILIGGLAFLAFAFFFNRATLSITAEAPFFVNVVGITSQNCNQSPCDITLAPGHYQLQVRKDNFFDLEEEVDLPFGQTTSKSYSFKAVPTLKLTGNKFSENSAKSFSVADSPENARPTLYHDGQPVLYFTRSIKKYQLELSPNQQKIALIDQTNPLAQTLYLLDLSAKTRLALEQDQQYFGVRWLSDNALIVQRRNLKTIQDELYLYRDLTSSPELLDLISSVDLIQPVSDHQFAYIEPFPVLDDGTRPTGFLVYSYDLNTGKTKQIYSNNNENFPSKLEYRPADQSFYLEINQNIYQLGPI